MKTFRFTGSPALYIECDVRMCHGRCPSQPCHWRNLKGVTKREAPSEPANSTLSDNISLFQSIRVIQDEDDSTSREQLTSSNFIFYFSSLLINRQLSFRREKPNGDLHEDIHSLGSNRHEFNAALHSRRFTLRNLHSLTTAHQREVLYGLVMRIRWT